MKKSVSKKGKKVPSIYLDTSIIRKLIEKEPPPLMGLMTTIKDKKWNCFTSTLGILELCDLKKDDIYLKKRVREKAEYKEVIRGRDKKQLHKNDFKILDEYVNKFFKKYPFFSSYQIPVVVWQDAYFISLNSNVPFIDAVHLATAIAYNANLLITDDTHFIKESLIFLKDFKLQNRIKVILPEKVHDSLHECGFKLY